MTQQALEILKQIQESADFEKLNNRALQHHIDILKYNLCQLDSKQSEDVTRSAHFVHGFRRAMPHFSTPYTDLQRLLQAFLFELYVKCNVDIG